LGECHRQQGNFKEALRYFRMAADSALQPEHLAAKKLALYHAGGLAAKLRMRRLAERYLGELQRLDANYKDAPAMLAEARRQLAAL
jgi:tetratricopeptide (TPR) repeat protein